MTPALQQQHERWASPFSWLRSFRDAASRFPLPAPFSLGLDQPKPRWPSLTSKHRRAAAQIIAEVAAAHLVRVRDVTGDSRYRPYVRARHEAMWRCRHEIIVGGAPISTTEIGRLFDRDHTTAMYAIAKHQARLDERSGRC